MNAKPEFKNHDSPLYVTCRRTLQAVEDRLRIEVKDPRTVKQIMELVVEYGNANFDYGEAPFNPVE